MPPPPGDPAPSRPEPAPEFRTAWVAALDRLELDVAHAETLLRSASAEELPALEPWAPPPVRGPLPSDLEPRARMVLERQLAVAHAVTQRVTLTGRHRRFTQAIRDTASPDLPVYLDLNA